MKELSIEEKAQAYDEAKARISIAYNNNRCTIGFMNEIFPELKESEDERIRKELIEQVVYIIPNNDEVDSEGNVLPTYQKRIDKYRAWLEKKGEQKPADKIQLGKKYKCIASPRYSAFVKGEIYKPEDKFLCSLMNFCYDCFEPIEDGEKKSADKAESNLLTVERAKEMSPFMRSGFENEYAAWSEEDEKTWKELIEEVKDQLDSVPSPDCMGKEDEKVLKQLTRWLDWLKSLKDRHTWKPSDEQMDMLAKVCSTLHLTSGENEIMESIYDALKKLKG